VTSVLLTAANAAVAKVAIVAGGLSPMRLSEARSLGSFLVLFGGLALLRPHVLRLNRRDWGPIVLFGAVGVALGQLLFYTAVEHLDIGVAVVIVYLAPVIVAAWSRLIGREPVRRRLWLALGLGLVGLSLVVELWSGIGLSRVGVLAALAGAVTYAVYVIAADEGMRRGSDPLSFVAWGFAFATIFWSIVQPWWTFPAELIRQDVLLLGRLDEIITPMWLLIGLSVVVGTALPFILFVAALRYLSPTRLILIAMLEPVFAGVIAFVWLREQLSAQQAVGGIVVLCAVALAKTSRSRILPQR
jgi:drug/metabolite transporter (DMT)-like permease